MGGVVALIKGLVLVSCRVPTDKAQAVSCRDGGGTQHA